MLGVYRQRLREVPSDDLDEQEQRENEALGDEDVNVEDGEGEERTQEGGTAQHP